MNKKTDGGEWINRDVDIHHCIKPEYDSKMKPGDQWRCDSCKTIWEVTGFEYGTQWDPINPPAIKWEKLIFGTSEYCRY